MAPLGGETALDQSDAYPKSADLSDNRGLYSGAPGGNKRTTNQKLTQNLYILLIQNFTHTTYTILL